MKHTCRAFFLRSLPPSLFLTPRFRTTSISRAIQRRSLSSMSDMETGHNEAVELQLRPSAAPSEPMVDDKSDAEARTSSSEASLEDQQDEPTVTKSTQNDVGDMRRMGKNQQLVRHFRQLSVTSFGVLATAAWEIGLFLLSPGLINGGRAGLVWNYLWNFVGFAPIYLSLAEMASMAPIAGVQYHWASEFERESCQRILSYLTGYVWHPPHVSTYVLTF